MLRRNSTSNLFLFNLHHEQFVRGEASILPTLVTGKLAIRQYIFLMLLIALPIAIGITLLISQAGHRITLILPAQLLTALIICAYFVLAWYLRDRKLQSQGKLIFGEVIRQKDLPSYAKMGTSTVTRIYYRFLTPENERIINSIDISNVRHRMPDGRKYPQAGAAIAVLYANEKNYKLL